MTAATAAKSVYEPTRIEDIAFPDWVRVAPRDVAPAFYLGYRMKDYFEIKRFIELHLDNSRNPYWSALHLCATSTDYADLPVKKRETVAHLIVETLVGWLRQKSVNLRPLLRDDKLLVSAFAVGYVRFNLAFHEMLSRVFRFDRHRPLLAGYVRHALEDKRFVQASHYAVSLGVLDAYDVTAIAFPLYAMNEMFELYAYLAADKGAQVRFVALLDSLGCGGPGKANELVAKIGIPKAVSYNLELKTLFRNIKKLATKYEVPEEHWSGASAAQLASTLRYFMHLAYDERAVPEDDFESLLVDFLQDCRKLQREAIEQMCKFGDTRRAVHFARKYGFKEEDENLPYDVRDALGAGSCDLPLKQNAGGRCQMRASFQDLGLDDEYDDEYVYVDHDDDYVYVDEDFDDDDDDDEPNAWPCGAAASPPSKKFYLPGVNPQEIHSICSRSEFEQCITDIAKNAKTVALDCEWRPLYRGRQARLALIQLATDCGRVYLLDLQSLNMDLGSRHWRSLADKVFRNPVIEKLAFSIQGDLKMLAALDVAFTDAERPVMVNLTDVMTLCTNVLTKNPGLFKYYKGSEPKGRSLSTFTELCLGKPLDKAQQFSDWEKRPLRETQVSYAVADVCCLLDIYKSLTTKCLFRNVDMACLKTSK